jgi:hypothetical protein
VRLRATVGVRLEKEHTRRRNWEETLFDDTPLVPGLTVYGLRNFPGKVTGHGRSAVGALHDFTTSTSVHIEYLGSEGASVVVASSVGGGREACGTSY